MKSILFSVLVTAGALLGACSGPATPTEPGAYLLDAGDGKADVVVIREDRTRLTIGGTWTKEGSALDVDVPACGTLRFKEQGLITYCDDCVRIRKDPALRPGCGLVGEDFPDTWISAGF